MTIFICVQRRAIRCTGIVWRGLLFAGLSLALLANAEIAAAATAFVGPSATFPGAAAVHYVADPGETNHVTIGVEIHDTGATITPGTGCTAITPNAVQCLNPDGVIEATLGDGDDFLVNNTSSSSALRGGDGDDRIDGGFNSNEFVEYLFGDAGDDVLRGREGADVLDGGLGADLMSGGTSCDAGTAGVCSIHNDTVTYAGRVNGVRADADIDAADDGELDEGDTIIADVEHIVGGNGNDVLGGITTNFFLMRLVGMKLEGRAGNDILRGTRAPDLISGGSGDDKIHGARRADTLSGGLGNDRIRGGAGQDRLGGGKGRDRLFARDNQRDRVNGGDGRDAAQVDAGLDVVISVATFF